MKLTTALITGASAGIGAAFARALASRKINLVLVARREEALRSIADELSQAHGIEAHVIPMDLLKADAPQRLFEEVERLGLHVDLLINNAGFGVYGPFAEANAERLSRMLDLNVRALTDMTLRFLPPMRAHKHGAIINVASVAAFQGIPYFAAYAASKAYVLSFSEALAHEVRPEGILVQALCPGTTRTEFFDVAEMAPETRVLMTAEEVVAASLRGLDAGEATVVPGLLNKALAHGGRMLPRDVVTRMASAVMKQGNRR